MALSGTAQARGPYKKGVERRAQIVRSASEVFAALGYTGGSLRTIAARVGTSSATLIQLFGSKEGLLGAVLDDWTAQTADIFSSERDGLGYFEALRELMLFHLEHRGLLELFVTLSAEASNPEHPAREWVQHRYADTFDDWSGQLRIARDQGEIADLSEDQIDAETQCLMAIADGLELQWLLNPSVDLPARFNEYLDRAIERWRGPR